MLGTLGLLKNHQGILFKAKKVDGVFIHTLCEGRLLDKIGLKSEQVVGNRVHDFLGEKFAVKQEKLYERVWQGEEVTYDYELISRHVLESLVPIMEEGEVTEIVGSVIDITELKEAEELLRKSEKLSIVGELAAGFAHEIRNPLTTIKGFLQLIQENPEEFNNEYLSIMLKEIDRIEMITNEFMSVAKPQATFFQDEDLRSIIGQVISFLFPQALLRGIDLCIHSDSQPIYVYGDANQLKQVFINLYKNAMEAMSDGGQIDTKIDKEDEFVYVSITDQGCGIPEELIDKLGEPFYSLKEKGTGLGLMISFKIIEAHKGTIHIESTSEQGTTVKVKIPISLNR